MNTQRLSGKRAVITGATSGIGNATAKRFIQEGAKVLITGRSADIVESAIEDLGANAVGLAADSTKSEDLQLVADRAKDHFGEIDVLFVNAGNGMFAPIADVDEALYGQSRMAFAANDGKPIAKATDVMADIQDVCDWIRHRHKGHKVALVGGSWGSITTALFASLNPVDTFSALVLYAPIYAARNEGWLSFLADPANPEQFNPEFSRSRLVSEAETRERWDAEVPDGEDWREEAVFQALVQSSLADDPGAFTRDPPSFEAPNGTLTDLWEAFNGRPLYDPGQIKCPVLLIRGGADSTSTRADALTLFDRIASPTKHYVEMANGAHFVSAEKRAREVFSVTTSFLKEFVLAN